MNEKDLPGTVATGRKCPQCGAALPTGALAGLCPACLLQQGASADTATQPPTAPFEPPSVEELARLFPQLEILSLLGKGGMGAVYKARQPALDRLVALKLLPAQSASGANFAERFNREARALARLSHPNIVAVHEFGQVSASDTDTSPASPHGGFHYFLMEFVDGVNLRQLQQTGRLSPREALQIVPQICDALQYAHDEGVVHRDIKPENVLVDRKGRVKIADFGLAKILGRDPADLRLTGEGQVMGTPHYMAPEQVEHPLEVDHRADIYALGVVFYEMLTGELPLGRFAPPSRKVQVDVRLDEVVLHALEKEPEQRYQHASEVKTDVENILGTAVKLPPNARLLFGYEYKSSRTLFGLPLIHIASGVDPATGRKRVARGIIAIGDVAKGVLAFGGVASGGLACGGVAWGVVAVGGVTAGLISIGGFALGLLLACGGLAIAPVACGGLALGYYTLDGRGANPAAINFFRSLGGGWWWMWAVTPLALLTVLVPVFGHLYARRQAEAVGGKNSRGTPLHSGHRPANAPGNSQNIRRYAFLSLGLFLIGVLGTLGLLALHRNDELSLLFGVTTLVLALISGLVSWRDLLGKTVAIATLVLFATWGITAGIRSKPIPWPVAGQPEQEAGASVERWSPTVEAGEKPDPGKILQEASTLAAEGRFEEALQRHIWYHNHALENAASQGAVRLSFALFSWQELGGKYPKARQALVEIRDRKTRDIAEGRGRFEMFQEVAAINGYLQDEDATYALFKMVQKLDSALAKQCYFVAEDLLVKRGEYELCLKFIGDYQAKFAGLRHEVEMNDELARKNPELNRPEFRLQSRQRFMEKTCQLIEILVATDRKAAAEKVREQAVILNDDPRLKSAVQDAANKLGK